MEYSDLLQFPSGTLTETERHDHMTEMIRVWILSDPVQELLGLFGFAKKTESFEKYLSDAASFAKEHMDFRNRKERFFIRDDAFAKEHRKELVLLIDAMQLSGTEELLGKEIRMVRDLADPVLLVMGGGANANDGRAELAARIDAERTMRVIGLSAERIMEKDSEITEFEHLSKCLKDHFSLADGTIVLLEKTKEYMDLYSSDISSWPTEARNTASRLCIFNDQISCLSCPSPVPERRANSFDTIRYLLKREEDLWNRNLVLISSFRYRPYIIFTAARVFRDRMPHLFFTGKIQQIREQDQILAYVQEVQAGIVSAYTYMQG